MINKNNLAIAKVASKNYVRPELACVADYGNRTVATDSFRLIEMTATGKKKSTPTLYYAVEMLKFKLKKGEELEEDSMKPALAPVHGDKYPQIDSLFERDKDVRYTEMKVNAAYLADICSVLKNLDPFQAVTIKIPEESGTRPMLIIADDTKRGGSQKARALLMPMTK